MSSFGFTFLSRKALGQAEQMMFGGKAGVRAEVGFLIVHQRYDDHFFPGTSVLYTRLRYASGASLKGAIESISAIFWNSPRYSCR